MTRAVTLLFLCFLLAHGTAAVAGAQNEQNSSDWQATVTAESAPVHAGVSPSSKILTSLNRGDAVTINLEITTASGKWYSINVVSKDTVTGYMDGKDLGVEVPDTVAYWELRPPPEPVDPDAASDLKPDSAAAIDIKGFVVSKLSRTLPISAFGQTGLHNRLGFDHRNAVDVALNPDSPEGQKLVNKLRSFKIPFLTFRHAIPGVATGAHIHVGRPSPRKAQSRK